VFKADSGGDQSVLATDWSACPAWAEYADNGAPVRIELQHGAAEAAYGTPRGNTVLDFEWQDGTLVGVRIRGDFPAPAAPDAAKRRLFRVRHQDNEISLAAEPPTGQSDLAGQIAELDNVLQAIDKNVRGVDKSVRGIDKKIDVLDASLREDMHDVASGLVEAAWRAHREPVRVDGARPLVLIAQLHRSGGTLLARLFDGHPEVLAFPQELIWRGDTKEMKYRWPDLDPASEGPLRIARRLVERSLQDARSYNLFGYVKEQGGGHDLRLPFEWSQWAYVETFLDVWQAKPPRTRRECVDVFMSAYFSAFLDWRGSRLPKKVVTAFKTNMNFIRAYPENEAFFADYPDGLMITLCRHPSDWYASATRFREKYAGPDDAMAMWRESTESSLLLKERHPDQVVLLPFEALVADPAKAMRRLADRIGLTWDPVLTVPTFNGMPVASNSSFESTVGIDPSVLQRRDTLPPETHEQVERMCLPLYQRFVEAADA
jgi:hypothetical protein